MFEVVRELLHTSESTPLSSFTVKRRLVDKRGTRIEVAENGNKSISECTCQEYTPSIIIVVWPDQRVCDRVITVGWAGGWDEMAMSEPT